MKVIIWSCYYSQVTELFDKLVRDESDSIHCQEEKHALNAILKINTSDPSTGPLRIPKQNKRPEDSTLASGYTSELKLMCISFRYFPYPPPQGSDRKLQGGGG